MKQQVKQPEHPSRLGFDGYFDAVPTEVVHEDVDRLLIPEYFSKLGDICSSLDLMEIREVPAREYLRAVYRVPVTHADFMCMLLGPSFCLEYDARARFRRAVENMK